MHRTPEDALQEIRERVVYFFIRRQDDSAK